MEGIRICFPAPGLQERTQKESLETTQLLSSLSLRLGACPALLTVNLHTPGLLERDKEVSMVLCLSIEDDWPGEPLLLRCSQLLLDREGRLVTQVGPVQSLPWALGGRQDTSLALPASCLAALGVNQFGFVVMPTDILLAGGQVLVESPARICQADAAMAREAGEVYAREVEEWRREVETAVTQPEVGQPGLPVICDPEKEKLKKFKCHMCDFKAMTSLGVKKHLNKQHPWKERGEDD